jgi:hypothetical protein
MCLQYLNWNSKYFKGFLQFYNPVAPGEQPRRHTLTARFHSAVRRGDV